MFYERSCDRVVVSKVVGDVGFRVRFKTEFLGDGAVHSTFGEYAQWAEG